MSNVAQQKNRYNQNNREPNNHAGIVSRAKPWCKRKGPNQADTALYTTARALQDMGRGGDEILAHITPAEAQLLHDITDGGSINPQTGLLEFWFGFGGNDDTKSYQSAVSKSLADDSLSDKGIWSGYESASAAYDKANSDGVHHDYSGSDSNSAGETQGGGAGTGEVNDLNAQSTKVTVAKKVQQEALRRAVVTTPDDDPALSTGFLTKKAMPPPNLGFGLAEPDAPAKPKATTPQPQQSTTRTVGMGLTTNADPRTQPGHVSTTQQIRNINRAAKLNEKRAKAIAKAKQAAEKARNTSWAHVANKAQTQKQKAANVGEQPSSPQTPTTRPGRVKVKPLNQYWTPNRPPMPPSKSTPSRRPAPAAVPAPARTPLSEEDRPDVKDQFPKSPVNDPEFERQKKEIAAKLMKDIAEFARELGFIGINRISPMIMLPGTRNLLKEKFPDPKDLKA